MLAASLVPQCRMAMARATKLLLLLLVVVVIGAEAERFAQPSYCRNRWPSQCCRGVRDDNCTVPIRDTFCYCDDFCLNENKNDEHDDCCPDYREVCLDQEGGHLTQEKNKTTVVCLHDRKPLQEGNYKFNCNKCTCHDGKLTCEEDLCLVDEELVQRTVNDPRRLSWQVTNYSMFWGWKAKEGMTLRTGTLHPESKTYNMLPILLRPKPYLIPLKFDARGKHEWSGLISGVRDQEWCGASWVFSTLDVAQDRYMIANNERHVSLSPQELLSCLSREMTCKGGYIERAWQYIRRRGAVEEECYPYVSGGSGQVSSCRKDDWPLRCEKYKTEPAYRIASKVRDIQWEIMTNGPVQALMTVHRDFFLYGGGVYQCPKTPPYTTKLHSVRILGWGVDNTSKFTPIEYWLVANSWGTSWGEQGLFRIQRGKNECGIESFVLAVRATQDFWLKKPLH